MTEEQNYIDMSKELAKRNQPGADSRQRLEGERDTAALNSSQSRFMPGSKTFIALLVLISNLFGGVMIYKSYQKKNTPQAAAPSQAAVRNNLPPLKVNNEAPANDSENSPPPAEPSPPPPPSEVVQTSDSKELSPEELLRQRRLSANLIDGEGNRPQADQASASSEQSQGGELQQKMQPLRLEAAMAGKLGDRHYLLTQGSMIDCVLETRLITTQPGMTACYVTRDIYSANGRVVLLDRGSKVIGHYQGGITQGQARIFVLWSRIETPKGVIINLDSPGTGSLGEGGVGGYVDTHFWERFGGAILLSLVDDFSDVATQRMANSNNKSQTNFSSTTNNAQTMAAEALKNSINIPPTLYKNQGERISIFVARDLDFRSVYDLQHR
jgi:type IV secretion system protein VirB10